MTQRVWYRSSTMPPGRANSTTQIFTPKFADFSKYHTAPFTSILFLSLPSSDVVLALPIKVKADVSRIVFSDSMGMMSLLVLGAVIFALCLLALALKSAIGSDDGSNDPRSLQARKDLYRKRRDEFRRNPEAMMDLREWKAKNNDWKYPEL